MSAKQYWQVRYTWQERTSAEQRHGHTVVTAKSQAEADAKFQRLNKHVTVISTPTKEAA